MQAKLANKKIIALTELTEISSIFGDANFLSLAACVWRSLTPPSKIGKGSGEPRIIDLCHKQNSGSSNHISERNSYIIFLTSLQHTRAVREIGGKDGWLV